MEESYEQEYFRQEKEQWWFQARRDLITKLNFPKDAKILEVGCGSGLNLKALAQEDKIGLDISAPAVKKAKSYGINAVVGDLNKKLAFKAESFDVILALDVIEHLESDIDSINRLVTLLKPNGTFIMNVPANMSLWSEHDIMNKHKKRYTKNEVKKLCKAANLKQKTLSYWNMTLFPAVYTVIKLNKLLKRKQSRIDQPSPLVNKILLNILKIENKLIHKGFTLPYGVSVYYIGNKSA